MSEPPRIYTERLGLVTHAWRVMGVQKRAKITETAIFLPTGMVSQVDSGVAYTAWGARRLARRAARYWCGESREVEIRP